MSDSRSCSDIVAVRERARWNRAIDRGQTALNLEPWHSMERQSDLAAEIKKTLAADVKGCRWSREQIAEGLTAVIGRAVTQAQIDAMVSETHPHRFPAEWIPAWVRITGSRRLLDLLCASAGLWVAEAEDVDAAELGRTQLAMEELGGKAEVLKRRLQERIS